MRPFKKILLIFWLQWVFIAVFRLSLAAASRAYSLAVVRGLLITEPSLVARHWLQGAQASVVATPRLKSTGSVVGAHRLSRSVARGIVPDQGSNPVSCIGRPILYHGVIGEALP